MATVQYGRREGQPKSAPVQGGNGSIQPAGGGHLLLPNGMSVKDVTILPQDDWNRIQYNLNKEKIEAEKLRKEKERKQKIYDASVARHSQWGNTVEGQWQRKQAARKQVAEKDEAERKEVDLEHQKYMSQQRKEIIEKAKTKQYFQTDRVKNFHSALMLTEVLKEREAQLELKRLKEEASKNLDQEWQEHQRVEHEEAILRDQKEAEKKIKARRDVQDFQKAQIRHHQKLDHKRQEEDQVEALEIKKLAAQFELEKKRLGEIREQESKQMMADNLRQIEDVKKMGDIRKLQEEEEDEECRIFAAAKKKMVKMRKEREKQLMAEKLATLDEIRGKLAAQMKQKASDEETRIRAAVEEADAKRAAEEAEKAARTKKMFQEISSHRTEQLKQQEQERRDRKKAELAAVIAKQEADAVFAANEEEKMRRKREEEKALATLLVREAEERAQKAKISRKIEEEEEKRNKELLKMEEEQFQEYAQKVIQHAEDRGRNTYPLKQAAKEGAGGGVGPQFLGKGGLRPSYMVADLSGVQLPNFQSTQAKEVKKVVHGSGNTGKRLGFVW